MISHLPVLGVVFGALLLLLGILKQSEDVKRASLLVFLVGGLAALPAYLTGNPALKHLKALMPTMATEPAEQHLEIAMIALGAALLLAVFSAGALFYFRKMKVLAGWCGSVALALALLCAALMGWTANLGGKVRHTEVRQG